MSTLFTRARSRSRLRPLQFGSAALFAVLLFGTVMPADAQTGNPWTFVRGDADRNGNVEFIDAFQSLDTLFGVAATDCPEALDVNDDGALDLADPVYLIIYLTGLGPAPEAPFPVAGPDPSPDLGYPCD